MKQDIIHISLQNLNQLTDIQATWNNNGPLDGELDFTVNGNTYTFTVQIKRELRTHQLHQVEDCSHRFEPFLLVANRLFPKIKEALRHNDIPYLEANGNIFLKNKDFFLFVDTQKPLVVEKNTGNRAFTKTGLKVLFYLLQNKDAINLPQRELAELTDVGLGNIPQIIDGLKASGFLIPLNKKNYVWENRNALLDRWLSGYATVLRPKLLKERFAIKGNWQELQFNNEKTVWGGEPAADLLTNHLRPETFLIYTKENRQELIKNYRLMPDKNGEIQVLDMFWKFNYDKGAPPLLVYADLMLEGGKRNTETANIIFREHIQPNL